VIAMTAANITTDPQTGDMALSWIGLDERGRELEIVAVEKSDCFLVIHVDAHPLPEGRPMTKRKIKTGPIGPDVDLEAEEVYVADGRRLTDQLAEEIAERALARHRGRPSVSGGGRRTPSLTVRVPQPTREALEKMAKAQGKRLAEISREALDEYISRHAS
jgi:hypothetical protein